MAHALDVAAPLFPVSQAAQLTVAVLSFHEEKKIKFKGQAEGCCVTPGRRVPSKSSCRDPWDNKVVESQTLRFQPVLT